MKYVTLLLVYP